MTSHPVTPFPSANGRPAKRRRARLLPPAQLRYLLDGFRHLLPLTQGIEPHLQAVLRDTLAHPGSLLRAQVAYSLMHRHGVEARRARAGAIAIEYFHTASLIFDDMPSMDDAEQRRGHPCPHRLYGEAAATLGALALITQAYSLVWQSLDHLPAKARGEATKLVSSCLGVGGILNGQSYDLHFGDADAAGDVDAVLQVAEGKTASLVRLALLLPAWIAELGPRPRHLLDRLATLWGLSYQIIDDFGDLLLDPSVSGKSNQRDNLLGRPNLPVASGAEAALERLDNLLTEGRAVLRKLYRDDSLTPQPRTAQPWTELESLQELLSDESVRLRHELGLWAHSGANEASTNEVDESPIEACA